MLLKHRFWNICLGEMVFEGEEIVKSRLANPVKTGALWALRGKTKKV